MCSAAASRLAFALQLPVSLLAIVLLARTARRQPGAYPEGALLVAATLLGTPYLVDYDLVCLALPVAWVMREAQRQQWLAWEKTVLLAAYVLPLVARELAVMAAVPVTPLVLTALLLVVARRARGGQLHDAADQQHRRRPAQDQHRQP